MVGKEFQTQEQSQFAVPVLQRLTGKDAHRPGKLFSGGVFLRDRFLPRLLRLHIILLYGPVLP